MKLLFVYIHYNRLTSICQGFFSFDEIFETLDLSTFLTLHLLLTGTIGGIRYLYIKDLTIISQIQSLCRRPTNIVFFEYAIRREQKYLLEKFEPLTMVDLKVREIFEKQTNIQGGRNVARTI